MDKIVMLGHIIKQGREDKGWTQQELADKIGIDLERVKSHEEGTDSPDFTTVAAYFFLLNIDPDITIYEDDLEDALRLNRLYRELQSLSQEQFDRLIKSAEHIRRWRKNHPDTVTLEDYWKTFEDK